MVPRREKQTDLMKSSLTNFPSTDHGNLSIPNFANLVDLKRINQVMIDEGFFLPFEEFIAKDVDLNYIPLHDRLHKSYGLFFQDDLHVMQHSSNNAQSFRSLDWAFEVHRSVFLKPSCKWKPLLFLSWEMAKEFHFGKTLQLITQLYVCVSPASSG